MMFAWVHDLEPNTMDRRQHVHDFKPARESRQVHRTMITLSVDPDIIALREQEADNNMGIIVPDF